MIIKLFFLIFIFVLKCFAQEKPHLIMIVADDLGWNDVSWHNPGVITPHLEDLAKSGIILDQSYVQPICTPTRSALMTGRYPYTLGRQHGVISPFVPTGLVLNATLLPEYLKREGYSTHAVGKWHLGFCNWEYTPTYRGFDSFHGYYTGAEDYYSHIRTEWSNCEEGDNVTAHTEGYDFRNDLNPDFSAKGTYSAYDFATHVEGLINNRSSADPMFLYMAFQSVHAPLMVPDNYSELYNHIHDLDRRTYLGMVTALDDAVGHIVEALKDTGHYNNSVIVFTTDNGGPTKHKSNNWPLRGHKATLWEGGTRGSAFIHSPLITNNRVVNNQLIHVTDWLATFVSLAGGEVPSDIDGLNQWPSLSKGLPSPRHEFIYNIDGEEGIRAGIRVGDFKLLLGNPGEGDWIPPPEVYNNNNVSNFIENQTESVLNISEYKTNLASDLYGISSERGKSNIDEMNEEITLESVSSVEPTTLDYNELKDAIKDYDSERNDIWSLVKKFEGKTHSKFKYDRSRNKREVINVFIDEEETSVSSNPENDSEVVIENKSILTNKNETENAMFLTKDTTIEEILTGSVPLYLFNLKDDPNEKNDISAKKPKLVKILLRRLMTYLPKFVPADLPKPDYSGDPKYFGGVWSPGWC